MQLAGLLSDAHPNPVWREHQDLTMSAEAGVELTSPSTFSSPCKDVDRLSGRCLTSSTSSSRTSASIRAAEELEQLVRSIASPTADQGAVESLLNRVRGLCQAAENLAVRERENENLTQVLRELSESRADAIRVKVLTLENYNNLQDEYQRTLKSAQLAQAVSRSNCSRANQLRQEAASHKAELHKAQKQVTLLQSCNVNLRSENKALRAELAAVERLAMLADCHSSASKQQFVHARSLGLY